MTRVKRQGGIPAGLRRHRFKNLRVHTDHIDDRMMVNNVVYASYVSDRVRKFTKADTDQYFIKDNSDKGDGYRLLSVQAEVEKANSNANINVLKVRVKD